MCVAVNIHTYIFHETSNRNLNLRFGVIAFNWGNKKSNYKISSKKTQKNAFWYLDFIRFVQAKLKIDMYDFYE